MKLPHKFGKYVLLRRIACGGMAEIYRAKYFGARGFAKDVAVKRILPHCTSNRNFETMLIDEAKALVHLQHQNIVQVFELGRDSDCYYISMEYVDGVNLREVYKRIEPAGEGMPEEYACFIISEVLKALEFAHRQKYGGESLNIVHRDVSPQNIMVSWNGEVKLADFGIAKGMHRAEVTTTNSLKGKYAYMSPEQASGVDIDRRSDIFSVGIVFYEMVTGRRMFCFDNDFDTINSVRSVILPGDWEARVPLSIRDMLKKGLAREADKRYQTAADFLKDINRYVTLKRLHTHGLELSDYLRRIFSGHDSEIGQEVAEEVPNTKVFTDHPPVEFVTPGHRFVGRRIAVLLVILISLLFSGVVVSKNSGDSLQREQPQKVVSTVRKEAEETAEAVEVEETEQRLKRPQVGPLMPSIGGGVINVDSEPAGAEAVLKIGDDEKDYTTPFVVTDIDVGKGIEASLILRKSGYKTVVDSIRLSQESPSAVRSYRLESVAPASISVHARPWGYVYIPGIVDKRESPVNGVRIKPGRHQVKVYYSPANSWARADLNAEGGRSYQCVADFTQGNSMWCK